jgi:hypothetical protein
MKKETAVEYLFENLLDNPMSNEDVIYNIRVFEQALEMEKQQIIDAYSEGDVNGIMNNEKSAEQYYNETFKL